MRDDPSVVAVEIHRGRRHVVSRVEQRDQPSRIRKTVRPRAAIRNAPARLRHEYAMLRLLEASAVPHVPRPLALEETDTQPTLVLEDVGPRNLGERLRHRALPTPLFLDMAVQLAQIAADLHRHRVIHRDINPSNLVVAADGRSLTLVDFGLATHVVAIAQVAAAGELAGTLPYVAPEQTGRVDRALDHRADLYSLGATLYEMLTGVPPFQSEDPAEMVHAHLAWTPVPPTARNPAAPEVLSNIILRLLEKMPERRYQSSEALLADLVEARRQWEGTQTILPFELGRFDLGQGLLAPAGLYGRQAEQAALEHAVETARGGACALVLLTGPAGIGKSRLVEVLRGQLEGRVRLVSGQADPLHGNLPYGPLAAPLRAFFRGLLREPNHTVARWRARLVEALGASAGVVTELIPELRLLIGDPPMPGAVGPLATENRFRLTLQALVQAMAESGEPLVLCLDDLQWADAPSLALLESLVSAPDAHHLLVVAACRTDESGGDPPAAVAKLMETAASAGAHVRRLALAPLDQPTLAALCAETLRSTAQRTGPLAELVLRKTAGNPFFAERFLRLLHRSGLLVFDDEKGAWSWDLARSDALAVTDNVVDLMAGAVVKLPPETRELLTTAACMRAQVDLDLLAAVTEQPVEETARRLWSALRDGLLVPARGESTEGPVQEDAGVPPARYRFVHDRVRQAAYSLLDDRGRMRAHLAIGRRLLAACTDQSPDVDLFDTVDQLHRGAELISDESERLRLAELALRAARRARASGSLGPALEYARHGIAALPPGTRPTRRELWLALHRLAADCAFCTGNGAAGEALFVEALEHASTPLEKAELHAVRVSGEGVRVQWRAATTWGREGLRLLGRPLSEDTSAVALAREVAAVRETLGGRSIADLVALPRMEDPLALAEVDLLRRTALAAQHIDDTIWSMLVIRLAALSIERGNAPASAYGYVSFGLLLLESGADNRTAEELGRAGVELARRGRDPGTEALVLTSFTVMSNHWQAPLRSNLPLLQRAVQAALEAGDPQMAGWAAAALVSHLFHSGVELARVDGECAAAVRLVQKTGQRALLPFLQPYTAAIRALQTPRADRAARAVLASGAATAADEPVVTFADHPMGVVTPFLLRDRAELERQQRRRKLQPLSPALKRSLAAPWSTFYSALAAAALFDEAPAAERVELQGLVAQGQRALATWAVRCPENFRHRADLVSAEQARVEGRVQQALALYDQAIEGARRQRFLHDEALGYELAGRCRRAAALDQTAASYLASARGAFARWGAAAKVEALDEEFPDLAAGSGVVSLLAAGSSDDAGAAVLDLQSLRKATETLASEVVLDRLLEKLIGVCLEIAGARYGALVLEQGGQLEVRATGAVSEPVALEQIALGASRRVPGTLVEHAFASGEPLALGDAARHGDFTADPYIAARGVKSALVVPIRRHGRCMGVLYLENDLATQGFPPERVRVLGLLSSQIAISLENSRLFEDLRIQVEERTRAEEGVRFLAGASAALAESLEYRTTLAEVARLAVPFLGDWCTVDVVEADGRMAPVAAVHVDPVLQEQLRELRRDFPVVDESLLPAAQAVRARAPTLIADVDEAGTAAAIPDPRHLQLVGAIGARAVLAVPLLARGRALGAITVAYGVSGRRYEPGQVALAQELARRAAIAIDNARLYEQAQQAIRLRDEFLTVASHELNTPIASLRLSVAPFVGEQPLPPPQTVSRLLGIVDRQTERLAGLVGEILDVSRVHAGALQLRLQSVDLTALVAETCARMEAALAQARCSLTLDLEPRVMGHWDPSALDRVLTNLLSNAMKFGAERPIEVKLRAQGGNARLAVRDRGIGIDPAHLPRIFERFARAVPAEHYGGLGLGLYIAREIVSGLGGTIAVDSAPGEGSTFTVELPCARP